MYVCMYVSMYVCMYVCMRVRMYVCIYVGTSVDPLVPATVFLIIYTSCGYGTRTPESVFEPGSRSFLMIRFEK